MNISYLMKHISYELHTIIQTWTGPLTPHTRFETICARNDLTDEYLPFSTFAEFVNTSENLPELSSSPLLFSAGTEENKIFYAYVAAADRYLLIGPIIFTSVVQMNFHINLPSLESQNLDSVLRCTFYFFCSNVLLAHNLFKDEPINRDQLIYANCVQKSSDSEIMRNYSTLIFERQELEEPHNPYDQDVRELAGIENGDLEMFKKSISEDYAGKLGTLSKNELRNAKDLAIVLITLSSRAAIRGGLLPEISFSMSDVFIQEIEELSDAVVTLHMARQFQMEYIKAVAEVRKQKNALPASHEKNVWVEECKDYVFKHLHEKIRIQDIAEYLHLNANYLSQLFKQCEGVTLTDFILNEKVKLTKNLLAYSPYSYIEIATYLGFSSQSHLGKVFKKYTGVTLRQYRQKYGSIFNK